MERKNERKKKKERMRERKRKKEKKRKEKKRKEKKRKEKKRKEKEKEKENENENEKDLSAVLQCVHCGHGCPRLNNLSCQYQNCEKKTHDSKCRAKYRKPVDFPTTVLVNRMPESSTLPLIHVVTQVFNPTSKVREVLSVNFIPRKYAELEHTAL